MRLGLINFFVPFALPIMGYVPFKYLYLDNETSTTSTTQASDFKLHEERNINLLGTQEFKDWIEAVVEDTETIVEEKSRYVDYNALIRIVAGYTFLKCFSKIVRILTVATLITLSIWKMVHVLHSNQVSLVSDERYMQFCSLANNVEIIWNYHKPHIGDYIEHLIRVAVDAQMANFAISSLLGIIAFFLIG